MRARFRTASLFVLAALAAGCGGSSEAGGACGAPVGSCLDSSGMACTEFSGNVGDSTVAGEMADCIADGETWSPGACSRANAVGGCRFGAGTMCVARWTYGADAASTMSSCLAAGGTWVNPSR